MDEPRNPFVSRGGLKLQHALEAFDLDVRGLRCADFGCNVGGFTDCLLQAGAAQVAAVDTGYGTLAWTLRQDPRVLVMERRNAIHIAPPKEAPFDLVVMDMGWTPQRMCVPAALKWIGPKGRILTLIKPHYELVGPEREKLVAGVLMVDHASNVSDRVLSEMPNLGVRVVASTLSPVIGGKTKGNAVGNREWLALLERA
jgi:23S rRNA (cytidine1920-2'-O)/16S rRNA (cytidine1409-2'-O)-methyltransferase